MKYLLLLLVLFCSVATAGDKWRLMVVHRDGNVVVNHPMDRHACDFARARVLGLPATDAEKKADADRRAIDAEQDRKRKADYDAKVTKWCGDHPKDWHCPGVIISSSGTLAPAECEKESPFCFAWGVQGTVPTITFASQGDITHAECFQ